MYELFNMYMYCNDIIQVSNATGTAAESSESEKQHTVMDSKPLQVCEYLYYMHVHDLRVYDLESVE